MKTFYNYDTYDALITEKYNNSKKNYKIKLEGEKDVDKYLMIYESMNVYPVYPRPIVMPLKKQKEEYDIKLELNNLKINTQPMDQLSEEVKKKIIEYNSYDKEFEKLRNTPKVRRFFDYEIRDSVKDKLKNQNISNAWIKMYELLNTYNLLENNKDMINTFHTCEHPGAFVHAVKYYTKNVLNKKHDFVFQSLKPGSDPQIFKPDKELLKNYSDKLDYGPKNGDITNKENIEYYISKYKNKKFDLITSDCGLDFSESFVGQESGLYKIFYGALITAIGLSQEGTNYIFKFFSFNDPKTIEMLQLACLFYERVDVVRVLTTKSGSGENYCVCLNYNYKGDKQNIMKKLIDYLSAPSDKFILTEINNDFMKRIYDNHRLISLRRITTMNLLLFRFFNFGYIKDNQIILNYIRNYTNYYVSYFLTFIGLDKIEGEKFDLFKLQL